MEDVLARAAAGFDAGFGPMVPDADILRSGRVPVDAYLSPDRFARETEIFRHVWLNVAVDSEIPHVGDWIVRDVEAASASILIVRGQGGAIRAFHNVCAHRALKLVWGESGCDRRFVCPYHAWTYDAEGRLTGVPDRAAFPDLDVASSGLVPVAIEVWKGLVFINLDPAPRQTLAQFLGGIVGLLEDKPLDKFRYTARLTGTVPSNWKAGLDAASEAYHIQALHRDSAKDMVCSRENPHAHFLSIDFHGPHRRMSNPRNPAFALSPGKPIQKLIFESIPQVVVAGDDPAMSFAGGGINPTRAADWSNDLISIFPNFQMSLALNGLWTMHYWPLTVGSFRWEAHYHFRDAPRSWRDKFALEGSIALNRDISSEDTACTALQQTAMASGVRSHVQFGLYEMMCRHEAAVMEVIDRHFATPALAEAAE
jgi:phenylpropionate dioxygenase-like ring-hydroxylating dioxygenase large terminal subunit